MGLITALLDLTPSHAAVTAFARSRYIEVADLGLPLLYAGLLSGLVLLLRMLLPRAVASRASVRNGAAIYGAEPVLGRMDGRSST